MPIRDRIPSRSQLVLWVPGLLAGLFVLASSEASWGERLFVAAGMSWVLPAVGAMAYIIGDTAIAWLLGEMGFPSVRAITSGVLLATLMWMWWQHDRDKTIDQVADCVQDNNYELESMSHRELVVWCYESRSDDSST